MPRFTASPSAIVPTRCNPRVALTISSKYPLRSGFRPSPDPDAPLCCNCTTCWQSSRPALAVDRFAVAMTGEHLQFDFAWRIAHRYSQQKSIQLAFRQRIRAFEFDRVLRGDHDERRWQPMRLTVDRNLSFAHRFQQGSTCVRGVARLISSATIRRWQKSTRDQIRTAAFSRRETGCCR